MLNRSWKYRSFSQSIEGAGGTSQVQIAPWAPPGELVFDEGGGLNGRLTFKPGVDLAIVGSLIPEEAGKPTGIRLFGEGLGAKYELSGYFIDERHIVGTVLCSSGDLAKLPAGTTGPFVLIAVDPPGPS